MRPPPRRGGGVGVALVIAPEGYRATGDVVFKPLAGETVPIWEMALAWRSDSEIAPAVSALLAISEQLIC